MTATLERIRNDIKSLDHSEIELLYLDLQTKYGLPASDAADVEAEWDKEIDERVKEIEDGSVQLLTAEESDQRTQAVFAKLGITRPVFRP